jgi:hypothetical protein
MKVLWYVAVETRRCLVSVYEMSHRLISTKYRNKLNFPLPKEIQILNHDQREKNISKNRKL